MKSFLDVEEVLIENQPSLKNPNMKTIATLLYSYFVFRGIIDKEKTKSKIENIKFISPFSYEKWECFENNKICFPYQFFHNNRLHY
jgi:hypothetical protein